MTETLDGLGIRIRRSKTNREGQGAEVAILRGCRLRPVDAVQTWLGAAEICTGPVFRPVFKGQRLQAVPLSAFSAAQIVKHYAKRAGLDPMQFAGHSLRSGFLTSAAEAGASVFKMMEVSRHKSVETLRGYVRRADLFREHGVPVEGDIEIDQPGSQHVLPSGRPIVPSGWIMSILGDFSLLGIDTQRCKFSNDRLLTSIELFYCQAMQPPKEVRRG